ncbi:MAG: hypothetical protein ACJ75H_13395 [Thermoanaerobaculia bacterium]
MKKLGCAAVGCAAFFALAVAVIAGLASWNLDTPSGSEEGGAHHDADSYAEVGALNQFQRQDAGDRLRLSYGFIDHNDRPHQVTCEIRKADYIREVASFGYSPEEMNRAVGERLRSLFEEEAARRGLRQYIQFEIVEGTGYRWQWEVPGGLRSEEAVRLEAELRDFDQWLDKDLERAKEAALSRYLEERGFQLKGEEISIDYAREVAQATGPLQGCFEALRRAGHGDSEHRLLGLFLAFVQELRYELPPEVEAGRHTLGFRVPSAVLAKGAGDCDSKAATFCSLWRHYQRRAILILVPEHALVGVEAKPRADEAYVRLGNRYFVLCEVAGPAKIPPGGESLSGSFEYVMIEPVNGP